MLPLPGSGIQSRSTPFAGEEVCAFLDRPDAKPFTQLSSSGGRSFVLYEGAAIGC